MTYKPKFTIGQSVFKWTGGYGGPGTVRGIANDEGQPLRYLVGHRIEHGFGEFYHVYAEGNLREAEGVSGTTGVQCPGAVGSPEPSELIAALVEAHRQVDLLLATVATMDKTFFPSRSAMWPEIVRRAELIKKHGASL